MTDEKTLQSFVGAVGEATGAEPPPVSPSTLRAVLERGARSWPKISLDPERFACYLGKRLAPPTDPTESRGDWLAEAADSVALSDLYLACGCLERDEQALAIFEERCISAIQAPLRRLRHADTLIDEVRQRLREKLLIGRAGGVPTLTNYAGRGDLPSWVRVIAVRLSLKIARRARKELPLGDEDLLQTPSGRDPEVEFIKETYRREFKISFEESLAKLSAHERNLLRHRFLDGLNIDQIADIYRIHRSTAARRLARSRERLLKETKKGLARRLAASQSTVESILRMVRTRLDVSIRRHLGELDE